MTDKYLKFYSYKDCNVIEILSNQITVAEAMKIFNGIADILKSINFKDIVIDLKNVTFIDSSGFGTLVNSKKTLMNYKSEIALVCRNREILQIINVTRFDEFIKVFPSLDDAVNYLQKK